ncbi:MAG: carbohydrate-binding domain-containing protein [Solobacterium sp.]|nr:carbohydrate-binding domain-containing protein [Solobacterium sp.]
MAKSRYTGLVCLIVTGFMILFTVLFMNSEALGVAALETDESANRNRSFSERDLDSSWDENTAVYISLDDYEGLALAGAYELNGDLYIISKGTYVLSGTLEGNSVIVDASDAKVQIVLDGVTITNEDSAGIWVKDADKVFLTLAEDTVNTVSLTGELNEAQQKAEVSAAIFSKDDLSINGSGTLIVSSQLYNGIRSTDDLVITGGTLIINAGKNGIVGKDSLRICGGDFNITAGNDGLKSSNEQDSDKGYLLITDGIFCINAGDETMQAETDLIVTGGTIRTADDDSAVAYAQGS